MAYDVPSGYHQQADADRIKEAQEFQKQQTEMAKQAKEAAEIATRQENARRDQAAAQAARDAGTSQRR
ncbi:hypothetical protein [Pedococcus sp. 2YAF34]|uniref:hypothetical protein n=1 Tax=Pedococcus sp. 2YAF34 TaxID=3233032 RepID=UPI003F983E19